MSHLSPSTSFQHNTMSASSELRPLYQLTSVKDETSEEELNSLSSLAEKAFSGFQNNNVMMATQFMPANGGNFSAHIGQECPINCACVCHLPSSFPSVNDYRPSVIMAPVAREYRASTLTHFPLTMQIEENFDKPSSKNSHRETVIKVVAEKRKKTTAIVLGGVVEKRKKTPSAIPLGWTGENLGKPSSTKRRRKTVKKVVVEKRKKTPTAIPRGQMYQRSRKSLGSTPLEDDSDDEGYFLKVNIDGQTAKFKLTKQDWDLMNITKFPSGGRLLGGAWTTIFKRGVKQSNHWCNVRFKNNHVRSENSRKVNSAPFFRGTGECKRPECNVKFKFVIHEERGKYVYVTYEGNVFHKVRESYDAKK